MSYTAQQKQLLTGILQKELTALQAKAAPTTRQMAQITQQLETLKTSQASVATDIATIQQHIADLAKE